MAKFNKRYASLIVGLIVVFLVAIVVYKWIIPKGPYIHDIWVINLDKEKERWANIQAKGQNLSDKLHRWPAVYGKDLTRDQAQQHGAGYVITMKRNPEEDKKTDKITSANAGAVGCWISHKKVLTYVSQQPVSDSVGHLICEDDVDFPENFLTGTDAWSKVAPNIPADWDIVFLGIKKPIIGTDVAPGVKKMRSSYNKGNWGAHAYLVRHGALKTKILPSIEFMTNEIDVHYDMMADRWNIYVCDPPVLRYNGELAAKSSINE